VLSDPGGPGAQRPESYLRWRLRSVRTNVHAAPVTQINTPTAASAKNTFQTTDERGLSLATKVRTATATEIPDQTQGLRVMRSVSLDTPRRYRAGHPWGAVLVSLPRVGWGPAPDRRIGAAEHVPGLVDLDRGPALTSGEATGRVSAAPCASAPAAPPATPGPTPGALRARAVRRSG
jgi:hypothetical protein